MRIKVCTKHYIIIKPAEASRPQEIKYDYDQDFFFNYNNNIISIEGSSWQKSVKNMEEALDTIKIFFYGTPYHIIDLINMKN